MLYILYNRHSFTVSQESVDLLQLVSLVMEHARQVTGMKMNVQPHSP